MRRCRRWKLGRPSSSSATTSPSSTASWAPERAAELAQLRVARRDVVAVAALQPQPPALGVADRAHAVPLDLVGPVVVPRGSAPGRASIGSIRSGIGSRSGSSGGSIRWIIQFLPPVLNSTYLPRTRSPWKVTITSLSRHLCDLEGAAVEDPHRPRAVVAGRDLAVEVEVLERVVLGAHGEVVALRDRPGSPSGSPTRRACPRARGAGPSASRAPSAPARRSAAAASGLGRSPGRFGRVLEVALGPVGVQAVGHPITYTALSDVSGAPQGGYRARPYGRQPHRARRERPATSSSSSWRESTTSTPRRPCASGSRRRSAAAAASSST